MSEHHPDMSDTGLRVWAVNHAVNFVLANIATIPDIEKNADVLFAYVKNEAKDTTDA